MNKRVGGKENEFGWGNDTVEKKRVDLTRMKWME